MRIDPDICTDPALLAAEVRRLQAAVQCLLGEVRDTAPISGAGKSAPAANTPPTLTDEEQLAIAWAAREADEWDEEDTPEVAAHAEALRGLAKRLF